MKNYFLIILCLFAMPAFSFSYSESAHIAYNEKDYLKAGQLYEKAYRKEKISVYLDNAIAAYLSHAFNLSNDKEYIPAIKYCQRVLDLRPNDKNAMELLSDIYYSRGSDYYFRGASEKARNDLEKSLHYSILPEQKQRALKDLYDWKIQ